VRQLGVYGANLPTKRDRTVQASDFAVGGVYGWFGRKYARPFAFRSEQDALEALGAQEDPGAFGWDAVSGFFANLGGNNARLFVSSVVGSGAAQASAQVSNSDTPAEPALKVKASFGGENEFGASGNRTGFTLERGSAFTSGVSVLPTGAGATARVVRLDSAVGVRVGDVVRLYKTGYEELHFVTAVDESTGDVTWADADFAGTGAAADYSLDVSAFRVRAWRRDLKGIVTEVDQQLGRRWLTLNQADPDRYAHGAAGSWAALEVLTVTGSPTAAQALPVAVATVTYLSGGADGTKPSSAPDWSAAYAAMNNQPVRFLANVEAANEAAQKALEAYCRSRQDNPIALLVGQMALDKRGAIEAGQAFQRSDEVDAVFVHNWLEVADPFATSASAPRRVVPNAGHVMGWAIAALAELGVHSVPARKGRPLRGALGVSGYQALADQDRTDLADAGANVIQALQGRGLVVRNWFTPSTAPEFMFGNGVLMRNYIKVSAVDSLQESENTPNDMQGVREDRTALLQFLNRLWARGSNGQAREGETFGQYEREDGSLTGRGEAFEVVADSTNNPVASLRLGERNIDCWFTYPAPAGSIKVGVGILYKVSA
jgi:hypothetical protein